MRIQKKINKKKQNIIIMHAQVYSCILEADSLKCIGLEKSGFVYNVIF